MTFKFAGTFYGLLSAGDDIPYHVIQLRIQPQKFNYSLFTDDVFNFYHLLFCPIL